MLRDLKSIKNVFHKLGYILSREQKMWSIFVFFMTIVGALFETLGVSMIIPLVQAFIQIDKLKENKYIKPIAEMLNLNTSTKLLVAIAVLVILVYILKNLYLVCLSYVRVNFASKIRRELAVRMMHSYMGRGYSFFLNVNTAALHRGVTYDVNGVYEILMHMYKILAEVLTAGCICVFMFYSDAAMTFGIVSLLGVSLIFLLIGFRKKAKKAGDDFRKCSAITGKCLNESLQGIKDILAFQRENFFTSHYAKAYADQQKADIVKTVTAESPAYFIEAICISGLVIVICIKVLLGENMANFIPTLATFAVAAFRILPSIGRISSSFNQLIYLSPALSASYTSFQELVEYEKNKKDETPIDEEAFSFENEIKIQDMDWVYDKSEKKVLENLNLNIQKGASIAFIGQSGAGKSTLADILLGLLVPEKGEILVDGKSIYKNINGWKKIVGYVPQTIFITDDTIRNNIAFGVEEENIDDEKVISALEQAQLMSVINELPDGLNTIMGERGVRFSGGQKQRVAIARALYNDPDILILDEATAALDNETENAIMEAIEALHGKKTLIIVAHRLTTIRKCDYIYEIANGKAVLKRKSEVFNEKL